MNNDEFYIGWEVKSAPGIRSVVRKTVVAFVIIAITCASVLAISQQMIGRSVFGWGKIKPFSGTLEAQPYPRLVRSNKTYYLVAPGKFGLDQKTIAPLDHQQVTLDGTLIYRDDQSMVEVQPNSIKALAADPKPASPEIALGRQTLRGEIVDSKCYLGVMNPGQWTPHRACAIRCISGGVPPILVIRQTNGSSAYLLLVSADGKPVNQQILDLVAEPVEITGEVVRQGDLLLLRADPATYRRTQ